MNGRGPIRFGENVIGWRSTDELESEFYPSDAAGLYSLLDAARERDDP